MIRIHIRGYPRTVSDEHPHSEMQILCGYSKNVLLSIIAALCRAWVKIRSVQLILYKQFLHGA